MSYACYGGVVVPLFNEELIIPRPIIVISAYFHSAATLNYIRAILSSGFADLHQPRTWSFSHVRSPALQSAFEEVIESMMDSLDFMKAAIGNDDDPSSGGGGGERGGTKTVGFYTSHEGLMLEYEEALTRGVVTKVKTDTRDQTDMSASFTGLSMSSKINGGNEPVPILRSSVNATTAAAAAAYPHSPARPPRSKSRASSPHNTRDDRSLSTQETTLTSTSFPPSTTTTRTTATTTNSQKYYNLSSHFIWIGDRTRQLDGAHVEYFRGIENPIGIKVGPSMKAEELIAMLDSECLLATNEIARDLLFVE